MDVGAIGYDKKGAGKDKGKKGGKDCGKKGAGKDQDKKGGAATTRFEGECGFCHKWGHRRRDCWARQQKGKGAGKGKPGGGGKTTAAVEGQSGSSMAAAITYDLDGWEADSQESYTEAGAALGWVMAVEEGTATQGWQGSATTHQMLYDSGSDENVCPYDLVTDEFDEPSKVTLRNMSGGTLSQGVQRRLAFGVVTAEGKEITLEGVFQASKACIKLVVSAGKLLKAGFRSELLPGGGFIWHPDGQRFPMYIKGNATYFEVRNVRAVPAKGSDPTSPSRTMLAAPVEEQQPAGRGDDQEAWEQAGQDEPAEQEPAEDLVQIGGDVNFERRGRSTLTPFSKVSQLRARLKELGKPQHGVKAELWKRVEKAEREHQKSVKEQQARRKLLREGAAQPVQHQASPAQRSERRMSSDTCRRSRGASIA